MTALSGLRLYVMTSTIDLARDTIIEGDDTKFDRVFYSRRGNGPIYRWLYQEILANWRPSRMQSMDFDAHKLSNASWKSVPETLQVQLGQHYQD
jgi:hypothetical protein